MSTLKTSKIYAELAAVLKIDCKDAELSSADKEILVETIAGSEKHVGISDDLWYKLSKESQNWVDNGIKAIGIKEEVAALPDIVEPESKAKETEVEETTQRPRARVAPAEEKVEVSDVVERTCLEVEEIEEDKTYEVTFEIDGKPDSFTGKVLEVTRRSVIFETSETSETSESAISIKLIKEVFLVEETQTADIEQAGVTEEPETQSGSSLKVKEAVKDSKYLISSEDGTDPVSTVCMMVTGRRGVFDESDGTRHRLDLDVEIQEESVPGEKTVEETKPAATAKPAKPAETKPKKVQVTTRIRELICADPSISTDVIKEVMNKEELKVSDATIAGIHKDTGRVLEILKDLGKLKD